MKINEIVQVNEGFWDAVKSGAQKTGRAVANTAKAVKDLPATVSNAADGWAQDKLAQQAATKSTKDIADAASYNYQSWSKYAAALDPMSLDTPVKYKDELDKWLKGRYRDPSFTMPATATLPTLDSKSVRSYLLAATKAHQTGTAKPPAPAPVVPPVPPHDPHLPKGLTVTSSSPVAFSYRGKEYMLHGSTWVDLMTGNPVNPAMTGWLTAQADKL
jgi:hypothetical protein